MTQGTANISPTGKVTGVSLGPGDPELITVKGLEALRQADKVYYPGSQFADGRKDSYSLGILQHYALDPNKLVGYYLRMSLDREQAERMYGNTYELIAQDYHNGLSIVVVSEGDVSTYSSFSYLLKRVKQAGLPLQLIPGVTSFACAAAVQQSPLCLQNDKLVVLPRVNDGDELRQCLMHYDTVVLMKIRSVMPIILEALAGHGALQVFYGERLGTSQAFTTTDIAAIRQRKVPYFALMIITK